MKIIYLAPHGKWELLPKHLVPKTFQEYVGLLWNNEERCRDVSRVPTWKINQDLFYMNYQAKPVAVPERESNMPNCKRCGWPFVIEASMPKNPEYCNKCFRMVIEVV
jgi:hypothetical protein